MPKITIRTADNTPGLLTRDAITDPKIRPKLSEGDLGSVVRTYHPGGPDELQLFEVIVEPGGELSPHGHEYDEILYVLEGEMHMGGRVLRPETSVYIPALTAYLIKAGPNGLRFLNFMGRGDGAYLHRSDLIAMRGSTDTVTAPHLIDD